ncbi:MAG TPA: [FeFe] hydrogenase H-cluster maturation GTPase HydF [Myxococcota bacterium]|nr:[FeFe] hydrogenase H-cluster maturation GTPase HydF [Myxococcota bacterium]HQP96000.1 [FeFe] hydrogenase H-cluster maturation GTPase HydF [Myxococcota bacterium]
MSMNTPRGFRMHIGLFGRRNVGKSSVLNMITRQQVSIVSEFAGTTTDPVEKPMELLPLGPVLFIDTAGLDDVGALGELRVKKTIQVFDRTDLGVIVVAAGEWSEFEQEIMDELRDRNIPVVVVFNKCDIAPPSAELESRLMAQQVRTVRVTASDGDPKSNGLGDLRQAFLDAAPAEFVDNIAILGDLVPSGSMAILVVPIDKEAPKGRLILPQVQSIRDILDHDAWCAVVKENELKSALGALKVKPALVVTDSQAFERVSADTPPDIPLTGFSILFARFKGDLTEMVRGTVAIDRLVPGSKVLIAESCSHHPITDDIGREKIPRWLSRYVGGALDIVHVQGHDFPVTDAELAVYDLVIHCGGCMWNRREMLSRILRCRRAGVPITNYGLSIAYSLGIFERALSPFPDALAAYRLAKAGTDTGVEG